jgi:hypothetical protein
MFMGKTTIYKELKNHQNNESWYCRDVMQKLHVWAQRFDFEFKLETPELTIGIKDLGSRYDGQFLEGHNSFGLRHEIIIDRRHIEECLSQEKWYEVLGTLLHEQLHAWQEEHGKSGKRNYHNKQFQRKAAELGLIISPQGYQQYEAPDDSPFFSLLEKHGVRVPILPEPDRQKDQRARAGNSKLKLWVCGCKPPVKVRMGRAVFQARCLICDCNFELASPLGAPTGMPQ